MTDPKQSKPLPKLNPFASEFIPGQYSFSSLSFGVPPSSQTNTLTASQPTIQTQQTQQVQQLQQNPVQQTSSVNVVKESWEEGIEEETPTQRPKTPPAPQQKTTTETKQQNEVVQNTNKNNTTNTSKDKISDKEDQPLSSSELEELERMKLEEQMEQTDSSENDYDPREPINLVFIGHVDAGKSTICGNILYQTGKVDERTIQKYEQEAKQNNRSTWFYAYIMDTSDEERAKGKTVEVGRAQFETAKKRYTILDAPGHKNYVPNMLMGVAQADIAVLVVSAKKGEFEAGFDRNGQTREHTILAKTLGLKKLVVAVNKMDDPTVNWDQARYDEIVSKLTTFLKQYNYNMKDVVFLPISGFTGINIKDKVSPTICPWYKGESLLGVLDAFEPIERNENAPLRVPILDKVREMGIVFLMGKVESGIIRKKDVLVLMPGKTSVEVVALANDLTSLNMAKPGENVRIGVKGVDEEHVHRGFVLCSPSNPIHVVNEFVAQVIFLDLPPNKPVFCAGYQCVIHIHTAVEEVTAVRVLADLDKKTGQVTTKLPKFVLGRSFCIVHFQINNNKELCMETFSSIQQLGRFTLRDEGKTIAFGKVVSLGPPKKKTKK